MDDTPENLIHGLVDKGRPAQTIEQRLHSNPAVLIDLRKFATFEMRSHRKENLFVGQLKSKSTECPFEPQEKNAFPIRSVALQPPRGDQTF
ncbi:MAG TPA: hypothetical protein VGA01_03110 [Candidatus Binatia bacterium]